MKLLIKKGELKIMKKKIIFLGMTAVSLITAGVVIPLVLLKSEDKKQKKDTVIYADKLKSLKTKTVTISATSGSVTSNKQNILNAIKKMDNFPQIPNGISLDVKDSNENLTIGGISIILIVKKESETDVKIEGFKVKRSKNAAELASDSIKNVKKILDNKSLKLVIIENIQAKVGAIGVDLKIIAKLQETIGSSNLDGVKISVKANTRNANIVNVGNGIGFIITLSKGSAQPVEITNWKVKRIESNVELATNSINNVRTILNNKSSKLVTIENFQAKVEASGVANKIVAKLQETIGSGNLDGVTISVKANGDNADILHTGDGIGFIITLLKGSAPSVEITDWKVIRTKPMSEQDTDSINNVKTILNNKASKLVTIENVQAKVEASGVATKIVAKLQEAIGSGNLEGVTISVKADGDNADILHTGNGIGFIITLSKGEANPEEITDWKVIRTKPKVELETDSINNVKTILNNKASKLVTIENVQAKVEASGVAAKIVAKLQEAIGSDNLEGVTISVKADGDNADILHTGNGIGFIITLSKGEANPEEITNWKVIRTKPMSEQDIDSINNVKIILDNKSSKLVTIENVQAKVGASGVPAKIVAKLQEAIGLGNLEGVTISVKADGDNADIIDTGNGIGFIITLSKGSAQPEEIINWRVKRTKVRIELDTDSINNVKTILNNKVSKLLKIKNVQAKVGASGVAAKIVAKLQEAIGIDNLEGVTIGVKADTTNADIIDTGNGIGFIITLSKGTAPSVEITDWKVKREFTNAEKITNYFVNSAKKTFTIFGGNVLNTEEKILFAIKNHLANDDGVLWTSELQSLITTHGSEAKTSIIKGGATITYSIAYNDDSGDVQKIDLTINYVYTNAEKIKNYFANSDKKTFTIFGVENLLDTQTKILKKIKESLGIDDLWTSELQSLITTHSSETETSIIKDGPPITYSIAYNDDSGDVQKVDLTIDYKNYY